jgi:hypothetical protein
MRKQRLKDNSGLGEVCLATDLKLPEDSRALTVRFFYEGGYKHKIRKKNFAERLPKVLTRTA